MTRSLHFVLCLVLVVGCDAGGMMMIPLPDSGPLPADAGFDSGGPMVDCENVMRDGDETGVDCGGSCPACADGDTCVVADDCESLVCERGRCLVPTCTDGVRNGDESGTDCGGDCGLCPGGENCSSNDECISGRCRGGVCAEADCTDERMNGDETDVDCGGATCPACAGGLACDADTDCDSLICSAGMCTDATCADAVQNQDETSVDCGGALCDACRDGLACVIDSDCEGMRCFDGGCVSCTDMIMDAEETDVDCGGGLCPACADGLMCLSSTDCESASCDGGTCASCMDGARNRDETDVDCGGGLCPPCGGGRMCTMDSDCSSAMCVSGTCTSPPEFMATFPSTTSTSCSFGSCTTVGAGGGGRYFRSGDYVEETITGTGLGTVNALDVSFEMDDLTSGCAVGQPLNWDIKINGTTVGTYGYTGGASMGRHRITRMITFAAVSGTGAGGGDYTIRYEATSTVCSGGSSWSWFSGGTATFRN